MPKIQPIFPNKLAEKMTEIKNNTATTLIFGKFKEYKRSRQEMAKLAVNDFDSFKSSKSGFSQITIRNFKLIRNVIKNYLLYWASPKNKEEKLFIRMARYERLSKKQDKFISLIKQTSDDSAKKLYSKKLKSVSLKRQKYENQIEKLKSKLNIQT